MIEFVEGDDEGEEPEFVESKTKPRKERKQDAVGASPKDKDLFVIDSKSNNLLQAANGTVRVNLAKFAMRRLTEEDLKKTEMKHFTTDWYVCLVPAAGKHKKYHEVGENTGNLMKHMKKKHSSVLKALERLILETPKEDVSKTCKKFIDQLTTTKGQQTLNRFVARVQKDEKREDISISTETSALAWFLDQHIPFDAFDNHLFKKFCSTLNEKVMLASSTTVKATILPALYAYIVNLICEAMEHWPAFFVTFDGWQRHRRQFISQHYHGISATTFEYGVFLLDMIEMRTRKFGEVVAATLQSRHQFWTSKFDHIVAAGATADSDEKMQCGGRKLFDLDMNKCNCHLLQLVWEAARITGQCGRDITALEKFVLFVIDNATLNESLKNYQCVNQLEDLNMVVGNETRWEGDYRCVERAILLKDSICELKNMPEVQKIAKDRDVEDFLSLTFFDRLKSYQVLMEPLRESSKLFQTLKFPTGCFVPLVVYELKVFYSATNGDKDHERDLRKMILGGIKDRFSHILEHDLDCSALVAKDCHCEPSTFLKAAMFHPGVWFELSESAAIDDILVARTRVAVVEEALNYSQELSTIEDETARELTRKSMQSSLMDTLILYEKLSKPKSRQLELDWSKLKQGIYAGINHMEYWKKIACDHSNKFDITRMKQLVTVAASLLAVPASESVDESDFSGAGLLLSKERSQLSNANLERSIVIQSFIKRAGWSLLDFDKWVRRIVKEHEEMEEGEAANEEEDSE